MIHMNAMMIFGFLIQLSIADQEIGKKGDLVAGSQLTIVGEPKSMTLIPGTSAELHCEVFGTPVPTIQWFHEGKPISVGDQKRQFLIPEEATSPVMAEKLSNRGLRTFQMATTSSKIHIPCADANRAGVYTCSASNGIEKINVNATVRVVEKNTNLHPSKLCSQKRSQTPNSSPAEIYMWTESRMERPGVSVQLMCRANGMPKPKVTWYETDGMDASKRIPIQNDEGFMLLANGDLLVKKTPDDSPLSLYQCEATNEWGKDNVTVMLLEIIDDTDQNNEGKLENNDDEQNVSDERK